MLTINTDSASIALRLLSDASRRENGTLPVTAKGDGNLRGVMTTRPPTPSGNVKIMISLATAEQV